MGVLHLGIQQPSLLFGCCPANVFAVVFNESFYALKKVSESPDLWTLNGYAKASHEDFCIPLSEHAEKTQYYYINLDTDQFVLSTSGYGEYYIVEYWYKSDGQAFDRSLNTYLGSEKFKWDSLNKVKIDAMLGVIQENIIAQMEVKLSATYNPQGKYLRIIAWLEKSGGIITDTKRFQFELFNFGDGEVIVSGQRTFHLTNVPGVFKMEISDVEISPDFPFPIIGSITDVNDVDYTSCISVASYD